MTEPTPTGALACPFVAFEDDRDARADVPDHRHRCYAEIHPAPRAIAHQGAFCLSPGFAACPTFQDWARREAARAKPSADRNELAGLARPGRAIEPALPDDDRGEDDQFDDPSAGDFDNPPAVRPVDLPPARSRSRDWAAPPAWVAGHGDDSADAEPPAFLAEGGPSRPGSRGPSTHGGAGPGSAGSGAAAASAGLAGSRWLNDAGSPSADDPDLDDLDRSLEADRAARQAREPAARRAAIVDMDDDDDLDPRPVASAVASPGRRASQVSRRPASGGREVARPAWERSRRNEAYPTLKTRMGMPAIPRVALALGALLIAAVVMISLPFLLNLGGSPGVTTPPGSAGPSDSGLPSSGSSAGVPGQPTPQVYIVVSGDTITRIANRFKLTTAQLLAANPQIKNANSIKPGDKITIPSATSSNGISGASPGPS
jgi:nucleoid-associated protein YgaU